MGSSLAASVWLQCLSGGRALLPTSVLSGPGSRAFRAFRFWRTSRAGILFGALLLPGGGLHAQAPACEPPAARVVSAQGVVERRAAGQVAWRGVALDERLCVGDALRTGPSSRAALQLPDQTVTRIDQDSVLSFSAPQDEKRTWLDVLEGTIHIITRDRRALKVLTPFANAGIEGTEFLVRVSASAATILVFEGAVRIEGTASVAGSGEQVVAAPGRAPVVSAVVRPRDAVHWTLYYPPVVAGSTPARAAVGRAAAALAVGRTDQARVELDAALATDPADAEALALRAVMALVQGEADAAGGFATRAVQAAPASASALIARAYVQQAAFDLNGALSSLQAAVAAEPGQALAQARLAELWLALGDPRQATRAARAAVTADPALSLGHAVLGFAALANADTRGARDAFATAIRADSASPLPRFGLGLALIRDGDLEAGREQIELAVILDPGSALIRSYMGKAYYEEKRDGLAGVQLGLARDLDPRDPTAYFYDAIRKQTTNRPAEALQDLQTAVALNDNRAVYRSRQLLDDDLAARSAAQGRVYRDLGFDELALRKGWSSVATSPADHSGHRLLADSYSTLPRHEIARVNELLQSQLLQPLNITPIQPQLAEANLFILDSAGPAAVAFNEFNPMFNRDRLAAQSSVAVGGNDTWGADAVLAGIEGRWSFSLGGFHFETDGFRENNDLDEDVGNLFVQYQYSPQTSVLAEVRSTDREFGDLVLKFNADDYLANLRNDEESDSVRVGWRHAWSPRSTLIALVGYQDADTGAELGSDFRTTVELDGYSGELQYLYRGDSWRLVTGARYVDRDRDSVTTVVIPVPFPPFLIEDTVIESVATDSFAAYAYGYFDIGERLTLTAGVSFESVEGISADKDRTSPKLGLLWRPGDATVVRLGAFRTVQGSAFSRQDIQPSLEPTPVAGFNQFFFGSEGEDVWRYGGALDHRFGTTLYGGVELSMRDLDVPYLEAQSVPPFGLLAVEADVEEYLGRSYLYWTPAPELAFGIGYEFEKFDRDPGFTPLGYLDLEAHRLPVEARYFHPGGFSAGVRGTFVDQRGTFREFLPVPPFEVIADDDDAFVVVDAFLGYRLPRRRGLVSLSVENLFDTDFSYQDTDPENPRIFPERVVLGRLTLAF